MSKDAQTSPPPDLGRLRDSARQRFAQDLPQLLREHPGCWVAYHGERQVGVARHTADLHDAAQRQHLSRDEVMLFEIVSPDEEIVLGPMAFD